MNYLHNLVVEIVTAAAVVAWAVAIVIIIVEVQENIDILL